MRMWRLRYEESLTDVMNERALTDSTPSTSWILPKKPPLMKSTTLEFTRYWRLPGVELVTLGSEGTYW